MDSWTHGAHEKILMFIKTLRQPSQVPSNNDRDGDTGQADDGGKLEVKRIRNTDFILFYKQPMPWYPSHWQKLRLQREVFCS